MAVNSAPIAFADTITIFGIVTEELLLAKLTASPPTGAALLSVTTHASVPNPVMAPLLQYSALSAAELAPVVPVPLKLITDVSAVDELLAIVS